MNTVVLSGIYFCLCCQGTINISTNDHSACTKSHHFQCHVKYIGKPYPSPAHTLSFPDLGPLNAETWSTSLGACQFLWRGFGVAKGRILAFSMHWLASMPLNHSSATVWVCDPLPDQPLDSNFFKLHLSSFSGFWLKFYLLCLFSPTSQLQAHELGHV